MQVDSPRCYMPRCTRAICIPATIKMRSETSVGRIVNATNFERNEEGLLAIRLWRDYVIATLAIDGGIVFCFALASKLWRVGFDASTGARQLRRVSPLSNLRF